MTLDEEFKIIEEFIKDGNANFLKPKSDKYKANSKDHIKKLKEYFSNARPENKKKRKPSKTQNDEVLWEFIKSKHDLSDNDVKEYSKFHKLAMTYETILGSFLEEFVYLNLKDLGWIWCSGNIIQDIDFIKKTKDEDDTKYNWVSLQIKTSDNTENAPASRVRDGTSILKWYRRFSKDSTKDNWGELIKLVSENNEEIEKIIKEKLTDEKYKEFLKTKN
ncbi:SinI family restriction endonuclease [Candidatus Pelagibacter sp.]|nr:SinI family restriction endonuclease [Candidatus Pelagibacter sp.]